MAANQSLYPFRDINLLVSPSHYAFKSASSSSAPTLIVDRPTGDLRLDYASSQGARRVSSISGILGILSLKLDKYIVVISKSKPMGRLRGHTVYKVLATEFLPMRDRPLQDHDEIQYLAMLKQFIASSPMYFSYSLDLTNSFQRQSAADVSLPLWKRADDRFFWNRHLQSDLIAFRQGSASAGALGSTKRGELPDVDSFILP
ncbi:High affinity Ca2+/Mn2+ P-type ATPase-like protein, partial [Ascosphaera pollenicola]